MSQRLTSPDGRYLLTLTYAGEIRFGPPYYHAEVVDHDGAATDFAPRTFGDATAWSDDSRFVVLQEWLSTSEREGPRTRLMIIDFQKKRLAELTPAFAGFTTPVRFEGHTLQIDRTGGGTILQSEINVESEVVWDRAAQL